jgi:imidazole glycerol-phosphate synthase subunit HisH
MPGIVIVDYGMANLRSVQKAFEILGYPAAICGDPNQLAEADKVVLPGVGAFCDAMARLHEVRLVEPLLAHLRSGKPFFGICLGMQMLFTVSHEDGQHRGLDYFHGEVVRFGTYPGLKVPHMGWNQLHIKRKAPPLRETPESAAVYFVHSYYPVPQDERIVATTTDYPTPFVSAVWSDNVFHPEKSQKVGLAMLNQFARWR